MDRYLSPPPTSCVAVCVWIPLFALRCEEAQRSELASQPSALLAPDASRRVVWQVSPLARQAGVRPGMTVRSEEHTSELQSRLHLVCRLLLEKKKEQAFHIAVEQRVVVLFGN